MTPLAVVPIFVNAGTAVLPTVLAALGGAAALLLRPSALLAAVRRRPGMTIAALFAVAGGVALSVWLLSPKPLVKVPARTDWVAVAKQIIAREQAGAAATPDAAPAAAADVVEARNFSRRSADGSRGPEGLKLLWSYAPEDTMFLATPAVVGDRIYVAGCVSGLGDFSGLLACLDAATGKPLWEVTEVNGEPLKAFFSSPAVTADGKSLVIGQGFHLDRNCPLLCFDADTGKLRWQAKTTEHVESSPAILGDLAVVGVGAIEDHAGRPTGDAGHVLAVRVSDGSVLWRHPVIDAESSPAIDADKTTFVGSGMNGNAVVAIDGAGDKAVKRWAYDAGNAVTGTVTLAGDTVVIGSGNGTLAASAPEPSGAVIALDRQTGKLKWRTALADTVLGPVAFDDGLLVATARTGEVVALDAATGDVRWRATVSKSFPVLGGVALAGDKVYALAADGTLAVIDRQHGRVLEVHATNTAGRPTSALASAAPQMVNGRLYVATEAGGVRCMGGSK